MASQDARSAATRHGRDLAQRRVGPLHRLAGPLLRLAGLLAGGSLLAALTWVVAPAVAATPRAPVHTIGRTVATSIGPDRRHEDVGLPIAASHVEIHWHGNPHAVVTVAFATSRGDFGEPEVVSTDDVGAGDAIDTGSASDPANPAGVATPAGPAETWGQVMLADGARYVRVTSDRPIARLTVEAMDSRGSATTALADAAAALAPVADASVGEPAVISRAAWGADESLRFDSGGYEREARNYFPLQKLVVHHTDGSNSDPDPAATVRSIYYFHAMIRDWGDIGYNFLIDAQGRVYEGRYSRTYAAGEAVTGENLAGDPVRATHARDYNAGTVGIALLGTFVSVQPTAAARNALVAMLAWESQRHGLDPLATSTYVNPETGLSKVLPTIIGHRDVNPTDCPGDAFYATFPTLRQQVAAKIAAAETAGADTSPPTAVLSPMLTPTGGSSMTFGLAFDEAVTGVAAADFGVGGTSSGWSVTGVTGKGASYTITVGSSAPSDGTITLTLKAGSVRDLSGNTGPAKAVTASATYATDTTRPTVVLWATPHGGAVNADSLDVSVTFSEAVVGLPLSKIQIGGTSSATTPWTTDLVVGSGRSYAFTVAATNPANGTLTLSLPDGATTDPAGNPSVATTVSLIIDRTPPTTGSPMEGLRTGVTFTSTAAATVWWYGNDTGGAGLSTYDVEQSIDGAAFKVIATGLTSSSLAVGLAGGHTYRFAVRARDRAGNVSGWKAGGTTSRAVDQDSSSRVTYGSGWHVASSSAYLGGTVRYATSSGATSSYTFTGRAVALVSTLAASHGQVKVYLDGAYVTTVDTRGTSTLDRRVVWSYAWGASGKHTVRLVVVGTAGRPRVDLDAFLVLP